MIHFLHPRPRFAETTELSSVPSPVHLYSHHIVVFHSVLEILYDLIVIWHSGIADRPGGVQREVAAYVAGLAMSSILGKGVYFLRRRRACLQNCAQRRRDDRAGNGTAYKPLYCCTAHEHMIPFYS